MDDVDRIQERDAAWDEAAVASIRDAAARTKPGEPGECDYCGEWSGRIVGGACAPCRDKYRLG